MYQGPSNNTISIGEILDCFANLAPRKLLDHSFQFRVFLAHNLFQPDRHHACFLKLRKRSPSLYSFMLPQVAHKQHTVTGLEPVEEVMHLAGRCQG